MLGFVSGIPIRSGSSDFNYAVKLKFVEILRIQYQIEQLYYQEFKDC